jgi:hypothetical protein
MVPRIRAVEDKRCKLADKVIGSVPYLYMRSMRHRDVSDQRDASEIGGKNNMNYALAIRRELNCLHCFVKVEVVKDSRPPEVNKECSSI